ncbi:MAG: glycosyltransferase [Planctomycetota bacterium]|nr:glycosyltransferase [Planctomycetota bacterium]MDA1106208.1 glycosyltransferase [Planctomycetota bacterium]
MANIICMRWGTKFGPEYVNRLHAMVERHLARPHHFVCMTDDPTGLAQGIDARPLPDFDDPGGPERGWRKISTFRSPLFDLTGPTLFLDLDIVIVGSLDGFFEQPGEFLIIKDWARPWRPTGNSSVYRFEAGAHPEILEHFMAHAAQVRSEVRNEQEYISREFHSAGQLGYWPRGWCVSFKYACMARFPLNYVVPPRIPDGARIVVFHGHPTPREAMDGVTTKITRHVHPTRWVGEHWLGAGSGTDSGANS